MTRDERLAQTEARTKARLDIQRRRLTQVHAAQRAEDKRALARRHLFVGKLAQEAGLLAWDDATLAGLFAALTSLGDAPNPVAVLEALVGDYGGLGERGNGFAHAAHDVSPCRAD